MIAFALESIISDKPESEAIEDSREIGKEDEDCLHIADQELRPIRSSEENAANDVGTGYLHRFGSSFDSSEESGPWVCTCCSYENFNKHFDTCAMCGTKKENDRLLEDAATTLAQEEQLAESIASAPASDPPSKRETFRSNLIKTYGYLDVADSMGYQDEEQLAQSIASASASDPNPSSQLETFRFFFPEDEDSSLTDLIEAFGNLSLEDPVDGLLEPFAQKSLGTTETPACNDNDKDEDRMEIDDQANDRMQIDDVHDDPMPNDEPMWHVDEVHDPMHIDPTEEDPIPMQIETNSSLQFDDDHERSSRTASSISSSSSCRKRNRSLDNLLFVDGLLFEQRRSKRRVMLAVSPASLHLS